MGAAVRSNKFAAACATCGGQVAAQAGTLSREADKWIVRHRDGDCVTAAAQAAGLPQARRTEFTPTDEQNDCLALFARGESMVIEALAGTGKTSTLKLLAESAPERRGQYIAFNAAIVKESAAKFPNNVACNTAHSLAFRAIGKEYSHRLRQGRMSSDHIAAVLGITMIEVRVGGVERKRLAAGFLAGRVMQAVQRFCQSADEAPERKHFPYIDGIDLPTEDGRRTFANNDEVASAMQPFVARAWADLQRTDGQLRFGHDHYLKMWQLSGPRINADFILFDEAQDANPVMAAIVAAQTHAQVVYVGDSQQAIYEFTGAVNALQNIDSDHRVHLTQSFRFGTAVADTANLVLARLTELRVTGTPTIPSTVGLIEREDAVLCRTNAHAMETVLALMDMGRRPYLVGGGKELAAFAKAARDLMESGHTGHPELACFDSWDAVEHYVENDPAGSELKLMVNLVNKFGVQTILAALDNMASEASADVVVSTAHKAKGREWNRVRIGSDFPVEEDKLGPSELRLIYVAVTRAKLVLDASSLADLLGYGPEDEEDLEDLDDEHLRWVDGAE